MKVILFCQNAYAFGIMEPLQRHLEEKGYTFLWYVAPKIEAIFPFSNVAVTASIQELIIFQSDAIICPGNEVPHYLRGLKVQIFHGLAGEKKGHFRIRQYFDLYLTQGPYFTQGFQKLRKKYKNFEVIETGWPKLDTYTSKSKQASEQRRQILSQNQAKQILLYAPTFSPSLTSARILQTEIENLAKNKDYVIHIKFHDLMDTALIDYYKSISNKYDNLQFIEEKDIVLQLLMADLLISDTSSVIYEFLLLDKPVVTFNNISKHIRWEDIQDPAMLEERIAHNLSNDPYKTERASVIAECHPYTDGKSSERVIEAIEDYIDTNGVPRTRRLSWLRRRKINKIFDRNS